MSGHSFPFAGTGAHVAEVSRGSTTASDELGMGAGGLLLLVWADIGVRPLTSLIDDVVHLGPFRISKGRSNSLCRK